MTTGIKYPYYALGSGETAVLPSRPPQIRVAWLACAAHPLPGKPNGVFELLPGPRVFLLPQPPHVRLDRLPRLTAEGLVRRQAVPEAESRGVFLIPQTTLRQALRV